MGFREAGKRLFHTSFLAAIVVLALIFIPGIVASFWLKAQALVATRVQIELGPLQMIVLGVAILAAGGWVLLGLRKEE